ncbi:thioesterase domain-containing protein [Clostridium sp. HBUAS56017]|uniref:thioesterase II family protein n=1 Tax=Clostridium sp. HBUAS56017 TaxID=2571128 RepID=UPI00117883A7|nr:thioesterase domain-containing protein [Clostridium sp. HBUAS56017]
MKLFCLPYAGGASTIYYKWKKIIDPRIEIRAIELKGRGSRYGENLYNDLSEAVEDIYKIIKEEITNDDYSIFGHSMGSILSFELYHKIIGEGMPRPKWMFFSGHRAPDFIKENKIYKLPDKQFVNKVVEFGGTPNEVVENKELMDLVLPILKSDFRMLEEYICAKKERLIECNVAVLFGKQDKITLDELKGWGKFVNKEINFYPFEGDHFFINHEYEKIIGIIEEKLLRK